MEHAEIQRRWRWFSGTLARLGQGGLPLRFARDDGSVVAHEPPSQDDPLHDTTAAEMAHGWRTQTLRLSNDRCAVTIEISESDIGDHYVFTAALPTEKVRFFAAFHTAYLEVDEASAALSRWLGEAATYAPDDPTKPSFRCPTCHAERGLVEQGVTTSDGAMPTPASTGPIEYTYEYLCMRCDDEFVTWDEPLPVAKSVTRHRDGAAFALSSD